MKQFAVGACIGALSGLTMLLLRFYGNFNLATAGLAVIAAAALYRGADELVRRRRDRIRGRMH